MNHIILEGFMGSGKSAVGKALSRELGLPLIDIDKRVSGKLKMTTAEVYSHYGDAYYRAMETVALAELQDEMNDVSQETVDQAQEYLQSIKDNLYSFETDSGKAEGREAFLAESRGP